MDLKVIILINYLGGGGGGGYGGGLWPGVIFKIVIGFGGSFSDKGVLCGGSF